MTIIYSDFTSSSINTTFQNMGLIYPCYVILRELSLISFVKGLVPYVISYTSSYSLDDLYSVAFYDKISWTNWVISIEFFFLKK
jgi:hypothetical protein